MTDEEFRRDLIRLTGIDPNALRKLSAGKLPSKRIKPTMAWRKRPPTRKPATAR